VGFEVFPKRSGSRRFEGPWVTHLASGDFSINREAYAMLGRPDRLFVLYDPDTSRVAFRAASKSDDGSYPVRRRSGYIGVAGSGMCRHYGIPRGEAVRYPAVLLAGDLVIDLLGDSIRVGRSGHPVRRGRAAV